MPHYDRDTNIRIAYNTEGHAREFTINIPGYGLENYIPKHVETTMQRLLGAEYMVCSRGSRLEVNSQLFTGDGDEHLDTVQAAVLDAVAPLFPAQPDVFTDLRPYVAPVPSKRACPCCEQQLTIAEIVQHLRSRRQTAA